MEENRDVRTRNYSDNTLRFSIHFTLKDTNAPDPSQMEKKVLIHLEDHCGPESYHGFL